MNSKFAISLSNLRSLNNTICGHSWMKREMSKNYDNWEKIVAAVLKREQFRELALSHSIRSWSSISDDVVTSCFSCRLDDHRQLVVFKGQKAQSNSFDPSIWERFLLPQDQPPAMIGVIFLPVEARELIIRTEDSPGRHLPYSFRSVDAVEVNSVLSLDIRGKIKTRLLSSNTIYGVYLVFKLDYNSMGLERVKAVIRFVDDETDAEAERRGGIVHLEAVDEREREGVTAIGRGDGWMEVEIGSFYVDGGGEGEVEARMVESSNRREGGVIIEGMEFRPILSVKQL